MPRPPGYPRRPTALTKAQQKQWQRALDLLRPQDQPAAPEREQREQEKAS